MVDNWLYRLDSSTMQLLHIPTVLFQHQHSCQSTYQHQYTLDNTQQYSPVCIDLDHQTCQKYIAYPFWVNRCMWTVTNLDTYELFSLFMSHVAIKWAWKVYWVCKSFIFNTRIKSGRSAWMVLSVVMAKSHRSLMLADSSTDLGLCFHCSLTIAKPNWEHTLALH